MTGTDNFERDLQWAVDRLEREFGCHTVVLYGSFARGDATEASDIDLLGVRDSENPPSERVVGWSPGGRALDAFVFSSSTLRPAREEHLYMLPGKVLRERDGWGSAFLAELGQVALLEPKALSRDEKIAREFWYEKTLLRAERGDLEARYRIFWMHQSLLEDLFTLSDQRFPGPKQAIAIVLDRDPDLGSRFDRASADPLNLSLLRELFFTCRSRWSGLLGNE